MNVLEEKDTINYFLILMSLAGAAVGFGLTRKRLRRYKVRPLNRQRNSCSVYEKLVKYAQDQDVDQFFKYTRMSPEMFNCLLRLIEPLISKDSSKKPIVPGQRLAMTLHYLSEGCSMQEIAWNNYVGKTTAHCIIKETCAAIWEAVGPIVLPTPTEDKLRQIANEFYNRWNFPNCVGAVDGKHISIQCPKYSGSKYFSYKKTYSCILMATCDAYYKFVFVDIGSAGSNHDGAVFRSSNYGKALFEGNLPLPPPKSLPGTNILIPHCFVADAAFPLHRNIMRPYPGTYLEDDKRIFNMRLSRARRTIENAFGIMAQRWRKLRTTIIANEENCILIVKAIVVLHNFVQKNEEDIPETERRYCPTGFADLKDANGIIQEGTWRQEELNLRSIGRLGTNNHSRELRNIRDTVKKFFMSPLGAIRSQWQHIYYGTVPDNFQMDF